ncbi:aquaporin-like protein [Hypoxylon sp. FL1150]|nr:aquaporin-like protein [Hypoxylon sp. FL1150]
MSSSNRTQQLRKAHSGRTRARAKPQVKKKVVFSLGSPLPHVERWIKEPIPATQSPIELAELGKADSNLPGAEEVTTPQSEGSKPRQTAAGVTHGDRHNNAGQPVFSYQPSNDRPTREERTDDTTDTRKSKDGNQNRFAIDSEPIGRQEDGDVEDDDKDPDEDRNWWARIRARHKELLGEFLATCIAVFMGLASTLSVNLSANQDVKYGSYETTCWAWGFAWMLGIYIGGGSSGAHLNPAISICFWLFRGFPAKSCVKYVVVQVVASLVAGALAYGIYRDTIRYVDPTMTTTANSFFSHPQEWVSLGSAVFDQIVGSAIMMIAVLGLGDDKNNPPGAGMHAFVLGLLVTTLKFALGYNIGSALNPASDFGPRIIAWAVGYRGPEVWGQNWWLLGPWIGTLGGSLIGSLIYDITSFAGLESPVNYRWTKRGEKNPFQKRTKKIQNGVRDLFHLGSED